MAMPVEVFAKEGETCEIGDVVSELPGQNSASTSVDV
jgi:hypothetical protein